MNAEEYKLNIEMTQARYHTLNLTFEQAEKVYWIECYRDIPSRKHSLSLWEQWDYQFTAFREVLNDDQFKEYSGYLRESIKQHEEWLTEQNVEIIKGILYLEDTIHFHENKILPDLLKQSMEVGAWLSEERNKINYLKNEYQSFLNETKKEIIANHFRHNRMFMPNGLKESLLRHKLRCIIPDYVSFEREMDEPTKAVAAHLKVMVKRFPREMITSIEERFEEARIFNRQAFDRYYKPTPGWHTYVDEKPKEEVNVIRSMSVILMDKDKYDPR